MSAKSIEQFLNGPANWRGEDIADADFWRYTLSESDVDEIRAAVQFSVDQNIDIIDLNPASFPLPLLSQKLQNLKYDLLHGHGFFMLQGMPVDEFNREQIIRAYVGVGSWFGAPVSQNRKGHILGHVKDIGLDHNNPQHRIYGTRHRQPYHTDSSDFVGLLCLKPPKSGGVFSIASTIAVYNEMQQKYPDYASVLHQAFVNDRKGEIPQGKQATFEMAVFHHFQNKLVTMHDRNFIDAAQHRDDVAALTELQLAALAKLEEIAGSEVFRIDHAWQAGDMGFVHNHQILHSRTDYEDFEEPERKRHLLRLWLSAPDGWPLPPVFAERYGEIDVGKLRGGIQVPGMRLTVPFEAE